MPSCPCKDLIHEKGIVVGRKKNVNTTIPKGINLYLQKYWMHYASTISYCQILVHQCKFFPTCCSKGKYIE